MKEPYLVHSDLTGAIYVVVGKDKFDVTEQAKQAVKAVNKGHWIKEKSIYGWDGHSYQCSICGRSIHLDTVVEDLADYPYCHCGAYMKGESEK